MLDGLNEHLPPFKNTRAMQNLLPLTTETNQIKTCRGKFPRYFMDWR